MSGRGISVLFALAGCLSLSTATFAIDYKARAELAARLVRAAAADVRVAEEINKILNSASTARFRCRAPLRRGELTEGLADIAERELTVEEMREGIAYLESDVGRKHLVLLRAVEDNTPDKPLVSATERKAMEGFLDSSVGYRLFTRGLLWRSDLAQRVFQRAMSERRWEECPKT
jgi:hypothetical protein